ncbi:MAG: AsmA-like C-terminal region-containing protein [Candidatus Eiseniibacteriota bacterium]|jgi:hypothetical protein
MRALRWVGGIVGGIIVLLILAVVVLRFFVPMDTVRERAVREVEAATGYELELGELRLGLGWHGLSLSTSEVRLANPTLPAAEHATFFRLAELDVGVALMPLIKRQIEVTRLVLREPVVTVRRDAAGGLNLTVAAPPGEAGPAGAPADTAAAPSTGSAGVLLAVPEARIIDARLTLVDEQQGTELGFDDLDGVLRVALDATAISLAGDLDFEGLSATVGGDPGTPYGPFDVDLDFDLAYRPESSDLTVLDCKLALAAIQLEVSGSVRSLDTTPELDLELRTGSFEPARVLSLVPAGVPEGLEMAGIAELRGTVRGPALGPSIEGSLRLRDAAVTPPGHEKAVLTALNGELRFTEQSAALPALAGQLPGGRFELSATVEDFLKPRLSANLELEAQVAPLAALATLPPDVAISGGKTAAQVSCQTRAPDWLGSLSLGGRIDVEDLVTTVPGLATTVRVERCPIRLRDQSLSVSSLAVRAGRSDLGGQVEVKGLAPPRVGFTLTSNRLDLDELLPAAPVEKPAAEGGSRAPASGGPASPAAGGAPPVLPPIDGTVSARQVMYREMTATDVGLHAAVDDAGLHITDVSGRLLGGRLAGEVHVVPEADTLRYTSTLEVEDVQANELLTSTTPVHNLIYGTFDADLALNGLQATNLDPLRFLNVNGTTEITDGYLKVSGGLGRVLQGLGVVDGDRFDYDRFISKIVVHDGRVQLDNGKMLSGTHGEFHIGGSVGFDGSLDMDIAAQLPSRYLPPQLSGNARLVELMADDQGRVPLGFAVGGDLRAPKIQIQTDALEQQFQAKLKAAATEKAEAEAKKVEEKARDAVDGLLEGLFKKKD